MKFLCVKIFPQHVFMKKNVYMTSVAYLLCSPFFLHTRLDQSALCS